MIRSWIMENNVVPKAWESLLPEKIVSYIKSKVPESQQFWAFNCLVTYQDLCHETISDNDLPLVRKMIKDFLQ